MTNLIALLLFLSLLSVAALHLAWGFGSTFPVGAEKTLARTVVGVRNVETMPPRWACLLVAMVLALCALWACVMAGWYQSLFPGWMIIWGGIKLTVIFGLRGVLGYTVWWRRLTPEQPFARLDRTYYSPFCLVIAAGFFILTLERLA